MGRGVGVVANEGSGLTIVPDYQCPDDRPISGALGA